MSKHFRTINGMAVIGGELVELRRCGISLRSKIRGVGSIWIETRTTASPLSEGNLS
jgi:hypothetical protein